MITKLRHVGLDVHAETIAVAVAEPTGELRTPGVIPNRPDVVARLVRKLGPAARLRVCYEGEPLWLRPLLAAHPAGRPLRRGRPHLDPRESPRPRQDRSARCGQACPLLSRRRSDRFGGHWRSRCGWRGHRIGCACDSLQAEGYQDLQNGVDRVS